MDEHFEWDSEKAESTFRKHRVTFGEAATAFADSFQRVIPDPEHSAAEERWLLLAQSHQGQLLVVVYTERRGRIRIVSARMATSSERRAYEHG